MWTEYKERDPDLCLLAKFNNDKTHVLSVNIGIVVIG